MWRGGRRWITRCGWLRETRPRGDAEQGEARCDGTRQGEVKPMGERKRLDPDTVNLRPRRDKRQEARGDRRSVGVNR
jgi:hypothetical protein